MKQHIKKFTVTFVVLSLLLVIYALKLEAIGWYFLHNANATSQIRPDLQVTFVTEDQVSMTFAVDVSLVSPFEGIFIGVPKVHFDGMGKIPIRFENKFAELRVKEKKNKYK